MPDPTDPIEVFPTPIIDLPEGQDGPPPDPGPAPEETWEEYLDRVGRPAPDPDQEDAEDDEEPAPSPVFED